MQETLNLMSIYHLNAFTKEGLDKSFEDFVPRIALDLKGNDRAMTMNDDFWDESIKVQKRKLQQYSDMDLEQL